MKSAEVRSNFSLGAVIWSALLLQACATHPQCAESIAVYANNSADGDTRICVRQECDEGYFEYKGECVASGSSEPGGTAKTSKTADLLLKASYSGDLKRVTELLQGGALVTAFDEHGRSALSAALLHDHFDVALVLLEHGADVNAQSPSTDLGTDGNWRESPLIAVFAACLFELRDNNEGARNVMTAALLLRGAKPELTDYLGQAPLHEAATCGNASAVWLLVSHRAKIDLQSNSGFTPLMEAAEKCRPNAVAALLTLGAKKSLKTEIGQTAADLVAEKIKGNEGYKASGIDIDQCKEVARMLSH